MRQRAARAGSWLGMHPVEVVFAALLIVAFAYQLWITRGLYFFWDEWNVIKQAGSLGGWLEPFHGALTFVSLAYYRVLTELFGFDYLPVRIVGLIALVSVPAAYFLTTRREFGAPLAALVALPLLWIGPYPSASPVESNHWLALLGAIGCAAALNRGRRADGLLAAALTFALLSAGGGLAAAAACLVHNACTRAPLRRWLAVLGPTLLWGVWWLIFAEGNDLGPNGMSSAQALRFIRGLSYTPFDSVALGVAAIGVVLAVAFVAYVIWALTRGLDHGANALAWSVGLVAWGVGLVISRGLFATTTTTRYRYVALGLALLALVPRRPIAWPARFPITTSRRWLFAAAAVILVLGVGRGLAVRPDLLAAASARARIGRVTRAEALVVGLRPRVVPATQVLPAEIGLRPARNVRSLFARYGSPFPTGQSGADQRLVDLGMLTARMAGRRDTACAPLTEPFAFAPPARFGQTDLFSPRTSRQYLWSPDTSFAVDVRRFGDDWVRVKDVAPGEALELSFLADAWTERWEVRADGACRAGPPEG